MALVDFEVILSGSYPALRLSTGGTTDTYVFNTDSGATSDADYTLRYYNYSGKGGFAIAKGGTLYTLVPPGTITGVSDPEGTVNPGIDVYGHPDIWVAGPNDYGRYN